MSDVALKLTPHERVLYHALPKLLSSHGCAGAANDLRRCLGDRRADCEQLIDKLDECMLSAFAVAAAQYLDPVRAAATERVAALAHHLAQHEQLETSCPAISGYHLERAIRITIELGEGPGPVGVVR